MCILQIVPSCGPRSGMIEVVIKGSALYDTGDLTLTFAHNTLGCTVETKGTLVGEDIYFNMPMISFPGVGEYTVMLWMTGTCCLHERLSFTVYPTMALLSPSQPSVINRREHGGVRTFSDMLVSDKITITTALTLYYNIIILYMRVRYSGVDRGDDRWCR